MKRIYEISTKTKDVEDIWRTQIGKIRQMRKNEDAPVDTLGCHRLADPLAPPKVHRFQILMALMLSSQTKDEVTASAMARLKAHGCSIDSLLATSDPELEKLLCPVGFYKKKTIYIKKATNILKDKYEGDIPNKFEDLCSLPGVGPKMAHLVMQVAWNQCEGIAVDTHVHRIANRLGWVKTKTPEKTREDLQNILPREEWFTINHLLVGFGQTVCLPVKPRCPDCLCREICPASTFKKQLQEAAKIRKVERIMMLEKKHEEIKEVAEHQTMRTRPKKVITYSA